MSGCGLFPKSHMQKTTESNRKWLENSSVTLIEAKEGLLKTIGYLKRRPQIIGDQLNVLITVLNRISKLIDDGFELTESVAVKQEPRDPDELPQVSSGKDHDTDNVRRDSNHLPHTAATEMDHSANVVGRLSRHRGQPDQSDICSRSHIPLTNEVDKNGKTSTAHDDDDEDGSIPGHIESSDDDVGSSMECSNDDMPMDSRASDGNKDDGPPMLTGDRHDVRVESVNGKCNEGREHDHPKSQSEAPKDYDKLTNHHGEVSEPVKKSKIPTDIIPETTERNMNTPVDSKELFQCHICAKYFNKAPNLAKHVKIHSDIRPFNCDQCGKGFKRSQHLAVHVRVHKKSSPASMDKKQEGVDQDVPMHTDSDSSKIYYCAVCPKKFDKNVNLRRHEKIHTGLRTHPCSSCPKSFKRSQHLQRHMLLLHSDNKQYKCVACGAGFTQEYTLQVHIKKNHKVNTVESRQFPCSKCDKVFQHRNNLSKHMQVHGGERSHKCQVCDKAFLRAEHLRKHAIIHTGVKPHVCDICGKGFVQSWYLQSHKLAHSNIKPYKCRICEKAFAYSASLNYHMDCHSRVDSVTGTSALSQEELPFQCSVCGICFMRNTNLKKHMMTHNEDRPHKCDICNKAFKRLEHAKKHRRTHNSVKSHMCSECGKTFAQADYLKLHLKKHDPESEVPLFECPVCSKSLHSRHSLKLHMTIHTGAKPHKCSYCSKCFSRIGNLQSHERVHTGDKPYACTHCDKTFGFASSQQKHIRTHTGERPYKCKICESAFSDQSNLVKHVRTHNK